MRMKFPDFRELVKPAIIQLALSKTRSHAP
jgi:hypothetical protein